MARRKKKKRRKNVVKGERLHLLIRGDLKEFIIDYAERRDTSVSQIVTQHFMDLREKEQGLNVEQI